MSTHENGSQFSNWHILEAMIRFVEQPVVTVRVDQTTGSAKILFLTGGAQRLLTPKNDPLKNGPCLSKFENSCVQWAGQKEPVMWRAPNSRNYNLEFIPVADDGVVVVRFIASQNGEIADEDLEMVAREKGLTPAEAKVFVLMAHGLGNKEIAKELHSSVNTVRAHLRSVFRTLDVSCRVEAINSVRTNGMNNQY